MAFTLDDAYIKAEFFSNVDPTKLPADLQPTVEEVKNALENELGVAALDTKSFTESHDYELQDFRDTWWLLQLYQYPVVSIESYGIWFGTQKIADFATEWIALDKQLGTVQLIPEALGQGAWLYTALLSGLTTIIPSGRISNTLPLFFRMTYTAGLDYDTMDAGLKARIKMAVARRVAMRWLPRLDPMGAGSESIGIDGASQSTSFVRGKYGMYLEQLRLEDADFVSYLRRLYGRDLEVCVA
jgi:hypothetical protein